MAINKETLSSRPVIFSGYMICASLVILVFRLIFAGEDAPLPVFSQHWGLIRGVLDIITLFPALAFSALVVPYGLAGDESTFRGFSEHLFKQFIAPLVTAICAAGLYAALFFLALPLAQNYRENLLYQGEVYQWHKVRAQEHIEKQQWLEALQLIGICESVWKDSPEIAALRNNVEYALGEEQIERSLQRLENKSARDLNSASVSALPGQGNPVDAVEAITMSETALAEERFFDAHWLATLARRIAPLGSPEGLKASRIAAQAWNRIESQQPDRDEKRVYKLYRDKLSGYEAMISGDWIRGYYIFLDLIKETPRDPDVENYLAACENGVKGIAFFVEEMELSRGQTLTNTVFSLPVVNNVKQNRSVLRIESLSATADYAYGSGIEYMVFDSDANLLLHLNAPYAKLLPIIINDQHDVIVLMRAIDRHDKTKSWEPTWTAIDNTVYRPEAADIMLNISYEFFLMLLDMQQDMPALQLNDLYVSAGISDGTGYIPEVFQAEILNRLGACLFFLPMAVFSIIIGWRLRARHHSRYFFVILLPILPLVFNVMVHFYRTVINNTGIILIFKLGFSAALPVFIAAIVVVFILSLLLLAAQHD